MSKSTAVDSVTTWVLRLSRDGHIAASGSLLRFDCILGGLCGRAGASARAPARIRTPPHADARVAAGEWGGAAGADSDYALDPAE
eukprot:COSAG02_NODE_3091_length_7386_cov_7.913682_4_plen_85_part_00